MAYTDLTPQQLNALSSRFFPAPPASVAPQPQFDEATMLAAQAGIFGGAGRLLQQFDRQAAQLKEEELVNRATQEINSINPLDPQYYEKVQQVQSRYAPVFSARPVQENLRLGVAQRREAEQLMEEQSKAQAEQREAGIGAAIRKADAGELEQFIQEDPVTAMKMAPQIASRESKLADAEILASTVPSHVLTGIDRTNPLEVKKKVAAFKQSLPPLMQKLDNPASMAEAVALAEQWDAINRKMANKDYEVTEDDSAALTAIQSGLETIFGGANVQSPDAILKAKDKIVDQRNAYNTKARPEIKERYKEISPEFLRLEKSLD